MKRLFLILGGCLLISLIACKGGASSGDSSDEAEQTFYRDADGDGYGDPDNATESIECPSGYVEDNTDCDDSNKEINPGLGTCVLKTFYLDADADSWGDPDPTKAVQSYLCPPGYVENNEDCNDSYADPGVQNCSLYKTFYYDGDVDGFGHPDITVYAPPTPFGFVEDNTDCDDNDYSVNPGQGNCPQ